MRGSRARTNFMYSDMPAGSSVTSIISPDEAQELNQNHFVPPPQNNQTTTQFYLTQSSGNACHFSNGYPSAEPWAPASVQQEQEQPQQSVMDSLYGAQNQFYNGAGLTSLGFDVSSASGYDMGNTGVWSNDISATSNCFSDSDQYSAGLNPLGSGSYLDFDTGGYVHSPLFGTMPPASDFTSSEMDGFDLGSSSYFF
ncbi:hypothetical protein IFM89_031883 [Coptis chinensis]|uniref:AP2/ERF domain-containing protein n=1 Tax=Coptis chinensis TaxID=261450 RepID=A0A835MCX6_9MAGN|nr:hypothetical protein IFM89_031883 [Coptis chinensis]